MALISEDGGGCADAESLASLSDADAYWAARPHHALAAAWAAAAAAAREGALREATATLDGLFGARFSGRPARGRQQALSWPRVEARDGHGQSVPADSVPREVVMACCELAARALSAPLLTDLPAEGRVIEERLTLDALSTTVIRDPARPPNPIPPAVSALLAPLLGPAGPTLERS